MKTVRNPLVWLALFLVVVAIGIAAISDTAHEVMPMPYSDYFINRKQLEVWFDIEVKTWKAWYWQTE